MNNKQARIAIDSCQHAYEYHRQLECAVHLRASGEVYPNKLDSGKYQISDGNKEHFEDTSLGFPGTSVCSAVADMEFKKRIADIPSENAASVLDSALSSLQAVKDTQGAEALGNRKRSSSNFCGELVIRRAKKEDQALNIGHFPVNSPISNTSEKTHFSEGPEWKTAAFDLISDGKDHAETNLSLPGVISFFPGYDYIHRTGLDQLEDFRSTLSQHSHRRQIPIGPHHQADLPQWTPPDFKSSGSRSDFSVIDIDEASADKRLGTCITPMPRHHPAPTEIQICLSKKDCDCTDEGSIRCVRQHVMEAREKLRGALGQNKFKKLGFLDMGEDVAQRWTAEEENLFRMSVLSNSASLGRNFWTALSRSFRHRSFKEIVSYYFNVFILLKRADQNRIDPLNADSDNDELVEKSDGEFAMEEEEEEDSGVESPAYGNSLTLDDDDDDDDDFDDDFDDEEDYEKRLIGSGAEENEGFCCGSGGSMGYKAIDEDVQDDSCTSFEGLYNAERHEDNLEMEDRNNCMVGFTDYDSKPWEIHYFGSTDKDFDFFPTCNVLEEVFGKNDASSGFS